MKTEHVYSRRWAILAVLCVSLLVVGLDNTILNVALPTLVRDLHASASQLQWIVDAYTIVFAGLEITAGSMGDRLGRKGALFAGLAIFGAGSALSAFSTSPDELVAFRCLMGVGGALVMPSTLSILTNVFTGPHERAKAIGIWSGTSGLGIAIGPVLGGWLLDHFWWGSVFLVNVPIVAVGLVAIILLVPTSSDPAARRADSVGTALSIAGLGLLLYGIIEVPVDGWGALSVYGSLVGGLVVIAAFVVWELNCDHPMFQMSFFKDARFSAANVSITLVFFSLFGALFILTQYLQSVLGYSPLAAGVRTAPVALMIGLGAPLSTAAVRKVGTKVVVAGGLLAVAGGLAILTQVTVSSGYLPVLAGLLVLGLGMGAAMAPATDSIMGSLPKEQAGVGSAMNGTTIQVGGALGVAVLGSIVQQRYRDHVTRGLAGQHVPPVAFHYITSSLGGALAVASHLPATTGGLLVALARQGFVNGVTFASIVAALVAACGVLVAAIFLPARVQPAAEGAPGDRQVSGTAPAQAPETAVSTVAGPEEASA
ncbi:MAG: MFS transporter [Acidimicrobiales bacterium]